MSGAGATGKEEQEQRARDERRRRSRASAAVLARASAAAARLARDAELDARMLRQQQEALAGDGRAWEPPDWRWRPLVQGADGMAGATGQQEQRQHQRAAGSASACTGDAEAEAAVSAFSRAADDLEAPLRGLKLLMPADGSPPLALLAFLRRGLDAACARARAKALALAAAAAAAEGAAGAAATATQIETATATTARILVLGGGAPLALAAAAAAEAAGWPRACVALVEPSHWGRRAALKILDAVAAPGADAGADAGAAGADAPLAAGEKTKSRPAAAAAFVVVASPAQAAEAWSPPLRSAREPAHVLVTDLFASGAVLLPEPEEEKGRRCVGGGSGSPFALGLLGALSAAATGGASDPDATAFVPSSLRVHAALASASAPGATVTCGVDLSPLDRLYRWAPPGGGGFAQGGAAAAGSVRALSAPFLAAEVRLSAHREESHKTTRVEVAGRADDGCNACLVWVEPVLQGAAVAAGEGAPDDGGGSAAAAGAAAAAAAAAARAPPSRASLWYPPHRPLPVRQGDALKVRASVACGRSAALALEFRDDDREGGPAAAAAEGSSLALVALPGAPLPPPLLDRPRRGALLPSWHLEMVCDAARNSGYHRAITRAVRAASAAAPPPDGGGGIDGGRAPPSPPSLRPPLRVLDIGAGSALLSVLAARW